MRKAKKTVFGVLCACALVIGSVAATLAYLTDSESVTNTFTVGDIEIALTETWNADGPDADTNNDHWEAKLIPGVDLYKDPVVSVLPGSEACWLFVEIVEGNWPAFIDSNESMRKVEYAIDASEGWQLLESDGATSIYYIEAPDTLDNVASTPDTYSVLDDNKVTVSESLTKAEMNEIKDKPTLSITAYAVQKAGFDTAEAAWKATFGAPQGA